MAHRLAVIHKQVCVDAATSLSPNAVSGSEDQAVAARVAAMDAWMKSDRFKYIKRPYTAEKVVAFQGSMPMEYTSAELSTKLYNMMRKHQSSGTCSHTFGALSTVQVVQMAEAGLTSVYVSGWQCSSTASTSNEPGPDVADYPMDTVPNKASRLFKAQHFHDRKQQEERRGMTPEQRAKNPPTDFLNPIIACVKHQNGEPKIHQPT